MRRAYAAIVASAAASALAAPAGAICGSGPSVEILPSLSVPGPANARVRLRISSPAWETEGLCDIGHPASGCLASGAFDLELRRPATAEQPPQVMTATRAHSGSGTFAFEELTPPSALEPGTYEVWSVERQHRARDRLIAAFAIAAAPDVTPPRWEGIRGGAYHPPDRGVPLECGHELAAFDVALPADDATPLPALRVAVWTAPLGSVVDYTKTPLLLSRIDSSGGAARVLLGGTDGSTDFIPDGTLRTVRGALDWSTAGVPLRFGMKIVDLAGNASSPSEIDVRAR